MADEQSTRQDAPLGEGCTIDGLTDLVLARLHHYRRGHRRAVPAWFLTSLCLQAAFIVACIYLPLAAILFTFAFAILPIAWAALRTCQHAVAALGVSKWLRLIDSSGLGYWTQHARSLTMPGFQPITCWDALNAAVTAAPRLPEEPLPL